MSKETKACQNTFVWNASRPSIYCLAKPLIRSLTNYRPLKIIIVFKILYSNLLPQEVRPSLKYTLQ